MYKKIGILGGVSPESTIYYYEFITREYIRRIGNFSYPEIIIYSVTFQEFVDLSHQEQWDTLTQKIIEIFEKMKAVGADFGLIAANTLHVLFNKVNSRSPIPLISIIKATAETIKDENLSTVGLLGTKLTMSKDFYKKGLKKEGITSLVPEQEDQEIINKIIFDELTKGIIKSESKDKIIRIIERMKRKKVEGIILGCTELPLLIKEDDCDIRLFNTAQIHAEKALNYAIGKQGLSA